MIKINDGYFLLLLFSCSGDMQSQLPLSEFMPLLSPKYNPADYDRLMQLKQRRKDGVFDDQTNRLAEIVLLSDPSNYNAWYCKKIFILNNNASIQNEYQFTNSCLGEKAKSFQVWQQKRFLVEYHQDPGRELTTIERILEGVDHKNYHAWSFRIWLINRLECHEEELPFSQEMIEKDCLNNSAWSYRFFLLERLFERYPEKKNMLPAEVEFVLRKIKEHKTNKASWNYLRGLFPSIQLKNFPSKNAIRPTLIASYQQYPAILQSCMKWWEEFKTNTQKLSKQGELVNTLTQREILCTLIHIHSQSQETRQFAINSCEELAEKDKQKANYWKWVQINL